MPDCWQPQRFRRSLWTPAAFIASPGLNITKRNAGTGIAEVTGFNTSGANGYRFVYTAKVVISPAVLTIAADAQSNVYGTVDPALTYPPTGLVNGDTVTGTLTRLPGSNVGGYAIGQGTVTAGSNYTITYVGASLTITPAPLTDSGGSVVTSRVYDASTDVLITSNGMLGGRRFWR